VGSKKLRITKKMLTVSEKRKKEIDVTFCLFCGNNIKNGYVKRLHCNNTCNRKKIYFDDTIDNAKSVKAKFIISHTLFKEYLKKQISAGEPILYYKEWEKQLRNNSIPKEILELVLSNTPLPKRNPSGYGLPKINIADRTKRVEKEMLNY
jgi:hypothetical protein